MSVPKTSYRLKCFIYKSPATGRKARGVSKDADGALNLTVQAAGLVAPVNCFLVARQSAR